MLLADSGGGSKTEDGQFAEASRIISTKLPISQLSGMADTGIVTDLDELWTYVPPSKNRVPAAYDPLVEDSWFNSEIVRASS